MTASDLRYTLPSDMSPGFAALRREGRYRDESLRALALARRRGRFLLTAAEGSGKTVLLSTLEALFKHGDSALEGLAGEGAWSEQRRYRVLSVDLARLYVVSDDDTLDIVAEGLKELITERLTAEGGRVKAEDSWETLLEAVMNDADYSSLVILIDNLDAPYLEALADSDLLRRVEAVLGRLLATIDAKREKCRFLLMTRSCALGPAILNEAGGAAYTEVSEAVPGQAR